MRTFQIESHLSIASTELWNSVVSPQGVNAEFWPFLRMTFPPSVNDLSAEAQPNQKLFRSWILLFGVLPVEYDDLTFAEIEPGRRFLERSEMLTQKRWQHEREIDPEGEGSRIIDRIMIESRTPILEGLQLRIFRMVFRYRHFRLRSIYGRVDA